MSVDARDPRKALFIFVFVLILVSLSLVSSAHQARNPDDEPDLDWFNLPRNPSNPDLDGIDQLVLYCHA